MREINALERLANRLRAWRHNRRHNQQYTYGRVHRVEDGRIIENVRLNKQTKRVEFVLWKAGEQNHTEDYWHEMGYGWELHFEPYNTQPSNSTSPGTAPAA